MRARRGGGSSQVAVHLGVEWLRERCPLPPPPALTSAPPYMPSPSPPLPALASAFLAVRMESISSMKMTLGCRQWGEEGRGLGWRL